MKIVTVATSTGYSWTTDATGTDDEILRCFMGQLIGISDDDRLVRVEFVTINGTLYTGR